MANPTAQVQSVVVPFSDEAKKWAVASTADTYYTGEMIGARRDTGVAFHFDDTTPMRFLGLMRGPRKLIQSDTPASSLFIEYMRPRFFSMPLLSGTASRLTDLGKPCYAADSGHVQLTPGSLANSNFCGTVYDILSGSPLDMSAATSVLIETPGGGGLIQAGFGTSQFRPSGLINDQTNVLGNGADTTEDTLHTFTLPKNTLIVPGQRLRIRAWGTTAANADTKLLKVYFGSQVILNTGAVAANAKPWYIECDVIMQSAGNQLILARGSFNGAELAPAIVAGTQDETAAIVLKDTIAASVANANDLTESAYSVEFWS
jgi:hypothetical protein